MSHFKKSVSQWEEKFPEESMGLLCVCRNKGDYIQTELHSMQDTAAPSLNPGPVLQMWRQGEDHMATTWVTRSSNTSSLGWKKGGSPTAATAAEEWTGWASCCPPSPPKLFQRTLISLHLNCFTGSMKSKLCVLLQVVCPVTRKEKLPLEGGYFTPSLLEEECPPLLACKPPGSGGSTTYLAFTGQLSCGSYFNSTLLCIENGFSNDMKIENTLTPQSCSFCLLPQRKSLKKHKTKQNNNNKKQNNCFIFFSTNNEKNRSWWYSYY